MGFGEIKKEREGPPPPNLAHGDLPGLAEGPDLDLTSSQQVFSKKNRSGYANTLSCKLQLAPSFFPPVKQSIRRCAREG